MNTGVSTSLLTIGEFAAATQLSPKALRLYDEQRILAPAQVDAVNSYRYYRRDQVAVGRLIRILRDMELPLAQVGGIVAADEGRAAMLLREYSVEGERRFARQKRAFQSALMLLGRKISVDVPAITQRERNAATVLVRPFVADRRSLCTRFQSEVADAIVRVSTADRAGEPLCVLVDPISEEEARFEMVLPIEPSSASIDSNRRELPAANCAVWTAEFVDTGALEVTGVLDALFDWLDRRGHRAIEPPAITFHARDAGYSAEISWAYVATR
ncbi:MAG TPA: MerR family transcriptional regulator [Steroidobacteraceae bacterium]|nr:MerR family transcriptional regulator [Steroidobacteraceae bacterium]